MNNLLSNLNIKEKHYKSKEEYKHEAYKIIRKYSKYTEDTNYKYFLNEVVKGLSKDCSYHIINDLIKELQRMKRKQKNNNHED
jgi:hypothetical protein